MRISLVCHSRPVQNAASQMHPNKIPKLRLVLVLPEQAFLREFLAELDHTSPLVSFRLAFRHVALSVEVDHNFRPPIRLPRFERACRSEERRPPKHEKTR